MGYFDEQYRRRQPYALIILLMFLSAVAGGIVSYAVAPSIFGSKGGSDYTQEQKYNNSVQDDSIAVPLEAKSPVVAVAQKVGPAVVGITNFKGSNFFMEPVESSGTGFIIDGEKGYIVTNNHVVAGARRLMVSLSENEQYSAQIVGQDSRTDLAVIKINANKKLPQVVLGDSSKLQVGEEVVAIGNPLGREFARSVTTGVVSALNREITISTSSGGPEITLNLIQTDAAINPGNSGGPLVDMQGQVVGINSVKIAQEGVEGMGFAIPIDDAKPIIQQIIDRGYVSRPFIGIYNFREITEEMSQWYDIPRGIFVGGVVPGSPADKAGIRPEDIIIEFDGKRITTFADLDEVPSKHKVGDRVKISVVRDGKRREFNLTLGEMPRNE